MSAEGLDSSIVWVIVVFSALFILCYILPVAAKYCQQRCARPRNVVVETAQVTNPSRQDEEVGAVFVSARVCASQSEATTLPVAMDCEGANGEGEGAGEGKEEREIAVRNRHEEPRESKEEATENDDVHSKCAPVAAQNILVMRVWTAQGYHNNELESPTPDPEPEPA